jgi:hypothetical protein
MNKPENKFYFPLQKRLHVEVCAILFIAYLAPLLIGKIVAADVKGVDQVLESVDSLFISFLYAVAFVSFGLPAWLVCRSTKWTIPSVALDKRLLLTVNVAIGAVFALTKVYVYKNVAVEGYAFDTGAISDPIWTFSMFLAEIIFLLSMIWLVVGRHRLFLLNILLLQMNLLHGTRIHLMVTAIVVFYLYVRTLPPLKILVMTLAGGTLMLFFSYTAFLWRHGALQTQFNLELQWVFSPALIESIFSQWSLVNVLADRSYFETTHIWNFLRDPLVFSAPRFIFPDKESLLLPIDPNLSPLGALNGIAASIIYLGWFFPVYWLFWGTVGAILLRWARRFAWVRVVYFVFCFNILLRLMRDGYVIPAKIMINDVVVLLALIVLFAAAHYMAHGRDTASSESRTQA